MSNRYLKSSIVQKNNVNKTNEESFCGSGDNLRQLIIVNTISKSKAILEMYNKTCIKILETEAFIGKNGITNNKSEGDGKTPTGQYELGIAFGINDAKEIKISKNLEYIKINENLYWIDDVNSQFYNQMVDITKVNKDWNSAEHLIKYLKQYEYAIEIKTNPNNIPGKGSAIFLHCSVGKPTAGCVAIEREKMLEILQKLKNNTWIWIK